MKINGLISEVLKLTKNKWVDIDDEPNKKHFGGELSGLVKQAYGKTELGSFINSQDDVDKSDWLVLDWDHDPEIDATIFYRLPRSGEAWTGFKIQGIGHDGSAGSKDAIFDRLVKQLSEPKWWIESSGALRRVLMKKNCPVVKDVEIIRKLFKDKTIEMDNKGTYTRSLTSGSKTEHETVFGNPTLK